MSKNFSESNTFIFAMIYPWIAILNFAVLITLDVIPIENDFLSTILPLATAILPVLVAVVWFLIRNKGLHKKL